MKVSFLLVDKAHFNSQLSVLCPVDPILNSLSVWIAKQKLFLVQNKSEKESTRQRAPALRGPGSSSCLLAKRHWNLHYWVPRGSRQSPQGSRPLQLFFPICPPPQYRQKRKRCMSASATLPAAFLFWRHLVFFSLVFRLLLFASEISQLIF